jgi:hypothetical protein
MASGAPAIKALLETPSADLADHLETVSAGIQETSGEEGTVGSSTYRGIDGLRSYYAGLARQVGAVSTSDPVKGQVLSALARLDTGLANLAAGFEKGVSDEAETDVSNANRRLSRASSDLRRAGDGIA